MKLKNFMRKGMVSEQRQFDKFVELIREKGIYQALRQVESSGDIYVDELFKKYISTWEALEFALDTMDFSIIGEKC